MLTETYADTSWMPKRISPQNTLGMVAAKTPEATSVGTDILAAGGNAVDAAVATAFAVGVSEPWKNGIGGGGYMVIWLAEEQRFVLIDFAMKAPLAATADMFPLQHGSPSDKLFGWPLTEGNRQVMGPHSIALPGTLAGLSYALQKYGTISLADALAPAIRLAEEGIGVTWHTTLAITPYLQHLRAHPETAAVFLTSRGDVPFNADTARPVRIRQPELAATLRLIADLGPDVLYGGALGERVVDYLQGQGTIITMDDFRAYDVQELEPATAEYHGHTIYTNTNGTGGTSLVQAMRALDLLDVPAPNQRTAQHWHQMASVFRQAFADRFAYLADPHFVDVPLNALTSGDHACRTINGIGDHATPPRATDRNLLGVSHDLKPSVPEYTRDGSTTHLSVIDGAGNAVSLTQTLLSVFGSFVTIPGTGILMNNGMMWFDPQPGRPNSIAGGKRPLSNMAPVLMVRDNAIVASLGASGGRRIMNCNAQLLMNIADSGMSAQDAIDAPRIDCSTTDVVMSERIAVDIRDDLVAIGYEVSPRNEALMAGDFSSPVAVRRFPDGVLDGGADPWYFPATVSGVKDEGND